MTISSHLSEDVDKMKVVHGPLKVAPRTPSVGLLKLPRNTKAGKIPVLPISCAISILVSVSANRDSQMLIKILSMAVKNLNCQ